MANVSVVFFLCCMAALMWPSETTLFIRRKPILSYLLRYKLGHLKSKGAEHGAIFGTAHGGYGPHHGGYGPHPGGVFGPQHGGIFGPHPNEEHFHHYYVEPVPYGAIPHQPPTILPGGQLGYAQFSLPSPLGHGELNYKHFYDLPPQPTPFHHP